MPHLLFKPQTLLWPTRLGWLAVAAALLLVCAACVAAVACWAHDALALDAPSGAAQGGPARILVVEGWMEGRELRQVVQRVPAGRYDLILTAGGPLDSMAGYGSYAARTARWLVSLGLQHTPVVAVPAGASTTERSWSSAVAVRDWLAREGREFEAIDVYSGGVHARRSRWLYRMAFGPRVAVGVHATTPLDYDPQAWWRSSAGTKTMVVESISLAWTACCFWPERPR